MPQQDVKSNDSPRLSNDASDDSQQDGLTLSRSIDALAYMVIARLQRNTPAEVLMGQLGARTSARLQQKYDLAVQVEALSKEISDKATALEMTLSCLITHEEPPAFEAGEQDVSGRDEKPEGAQIEVLSPMRQLDGGLLDLVDQSHPAKVGQGSGWGTGDTDNIRSVEKADTLKALLEKKRVLTQELIGRPYLYERVDHDRRMIVFSQDGTIGYGRAGREAHWVLVEDSEHLALEIASDQELTCRLSLNDEGVWVGRWLHGERMAIRVSALPALAMEADSYLETFLPASGHRPYFLEALRRLRGLASATSVIVEVGSARSASLDAREADGWSTLVFGWYAAAYGAELHTVDNSRRSLQACRKVAAPYHDHIRFHQKKGEEFLGAFPLPIDLLYLDAWEDNPVTRRPQYREAYRMLTRKPALILLHVAGGEASADLSRRALVQEAISDGYTVAFQSPQHLLLACSGAELVGSAVAPIEAVPATPNGGIPEASLSGTTLPPTSFFARQEPFRVGEHHMLTQSYPLRVLTHDRGNFKSLSGANVLIYWPHGFGDWVFLSYLLPLLSPKNRYWVTRFGDDSSSILEDSRWATPLYLGTNSPLCGDGDGFGCRHFGLSYDSIDGDRRLLSLPLALAAQCERLGIDTLLWSCHPEAHGQVAFPYHTKARYLLPYLADEALLAQADLGRALPSAINFEVTPWLRQWVEARLRSRAGFGRRKLCLISRNGYTAVGKNWGHKWREEMPEGKRREGEECRDFMRLLLKKDPQWMFLVTEDVLFGGDGTVISEDLHAYSYAQLFGSIGAAAPPFGLVLKALLGLADLVIGVPTGPYHLAMAKPGLPTVGLWTEHLPSWYDEPKVASRHLVGKDVAERRFLERPGSFDSMKGLHFETRWLDTHIIPAEPVLEAVEELLYS